MEIHFAPVQGFTDNAYREAYFHEVGNIDYYYTPYYSTDNIRKVSHGKKIPSEPEELFKITIPQILPGNITELKHLVSFVQTMNVSEININLGCPYPMATTKGRGAALIQKIELITDFINYISDTTNLKISIKSRIGLNNETEIFPLLEKLDLSRISNFIIHPRIASQLYKGKIYTDIYIKCLNLFPQYQFVYNGDIISYNDLQLLSELLPQQKKWMIGRGMLSNPFLSLQLKSGMMLSAFLNLDLLLSFVHSLINGIENDSNDTGHTLNRVKNHFIYLSNSFPNPKKVFKAVKKSKSVEEVRFIINHLS